MRRRGVGSARRGYRARHGVAARPYRRRWPDRSEFPWSRCPARRIRRSRPGGRSCFPCVRPLSGRSPRQPVTLPLAAQDRLQRRHRRNRSACREIDGAWLPLAVGDARSQAIARADAWLSFPPAARALRRARRSMPICCGTDMGSDMTNDHLPNSRAAASSRTSS